MKSTIDIVLHQHLRNNPLHRLQLSPWSCGSWKAELYVTGFAKPLFAGFGGAPLEAMQSLYASMRKQSHD